MTFHFLPSHWWTRLSRVPSWSAHDTLIGPIMPSKPSCLMRSVVRSRCSMPQRTCSPVIGFVAELGHGGNGSTRCPASS